MMNKKIAVISAMALLLTACQESTDKPAAISESLLEPAAVSSTVTTAARRDIKVSSYRNGTVTPVTHSVSFYTSGTVSESFISIGDTVEKFQVLAVLDNSEASADIDEYLSEREYLERKYELELSEYDAETEELNALVDTVQAKIAAGTATNEDKMNAELSAIKLEDRELYRTEIEVERDSALEKLDSKYNDENATITKNILFTEYSGKVVYTDLVPGCEYNQGETVAVIEDPEEIYITLNDAEENDIGKSVMERMPEVNAYINGVEYSVSYRGSDSDGNTLLDIEDGINVSAGDYVMVEFVTDEVLDALSVSADAIFTEGTSNYVYKLVDGVRTRVDVVTGLTNGLYTEITSGDLQEGDEIYVPQ